MGDIPFLMRRNFAILGSMSLREFFGSLFAAPPKQAGKSSARKSKQKECVGSSPGDLRQLIQTDQQRLEDEIETTASALRLEIERLSRRIDALPKKAAKHELEALREAQDGLRRVVLRHVASSKQTLELERELTLWERRLDETGERTADHPNVRAEIVRSELAGRGVTVARPDPALFLSSLSRSPSLSLRRQESHLGDEMSDTIDEISSDQVEMSDDDDMEQVKPEPVPFDPHPDTVHLIQAIREATREAERWHGQPEDDVDAFVDAADQVHQIRRLHAALKEIDRRNGVTRDRLSMAMRLRDE